MTHMRFTGSLVGAALLAMAPALTSCGASSAKYVPGALVQLLTPSVPAAISGQEDYSFFFTASIPNPPGSFLITGGTFPTGMRLDSHTGELSGVPRQEGVFTFEVAAQDGVDPAFPPSRDQTFAEDRKKFTMHVTKGPPNILNQVFPAAQYRFSYTQMIDVAGGTPPYTFSDVSVFPDGLGTGLAVSPLGVIGSMPTASLGPTTPYHFTVQVTDSAVPPQSDVQDLSLLVVVLPLSILTPSPLPDAAAEFAYSKTLALSSLGAGAPYTWKQVLQASPPAPPNTPLPGETLLSAIDMEITPAGVIHNIVGTLGPKKALSGPFVPPYTVTFTVNVTDEAAQPNVNRTYTLKVNPGPVLTSITPKLSAGQAPFQVVGLNFAIGATLSFVPTAPVPSVITPIRDSSTAMHFNAAPTPPTGVVGPVTVRVTNPDGGFFDKPLAFAFVANNLQFGTTPTLPSPASALSSTGLDVADANGDGFADFVHCGTDSSRGFSPLWANVKGTAGGVEYMQNTPFGGVTFNGTFTKTVLASGDWWAVKFTDMNTDGKPDIVAVGDPGGGPVIKTFINTGSATTPFTVASSRTSTLPYQGDPIGGYPIVAAYGYGTPPTGHVSDIAMGQFTTPTDSVPDLVYVHQDSASQGRIQTGTGYYGTPFYQYYGGYMGGSVSSARGGIDGAFGPANLDHTRAISELYAAAAVATGHLDDSGDAQSDLLVGDEIGSFNYWWAGTGTQNIVGQVAPTDSVGLFGTWTAMTTADTVSTGEEVLGVATGDINGDGRDDMLMAGASDPSGPTGWGYGSPTLASFSQNSPGIFAELPTFKPATDQRYVAIFDGNFDLEQDVCVTRATNKIDVYKGRPLMNGLLFRQTLTLANSNIGRVATGDFNHDGKIDICAAMSFFADTQMQSNIFGYPDQHYDRGNGATKNVGIFLNTSN